MCTVCCLKRGWSSIKVVFYRGSPWVAFSVAFSMRACWHKNADKWDEGNIFLYWFQPNIRDKVQLNKMRTRIKKGLISSRKPILLCNSMAMLANSATICFLTSSLSRGIEIDWERGLREFSSLHHSHISSIIFRENETCSWKNLINTFWFPLSPSPSPSPSF